MNLPSDPVSSELFPGGFEVMGQWEDPVTGRGKTWVRFYCASYGGQVGRDAFSRVFDGPTFLTFMCSRELRNAIALEPQVDLTPEDRERMAEILRVRIIAPKTPSFAQRVRACFRGYHQEMLGAMRRREYAKQEARAISEISAAQHKGEGL